MSRTRATVSGARGNSGALAALVIVAVAAPLTPTAQARPDRALEIEALAPLFAGDIPVNPWDRPYTGVRTDRYTYVTWTETGEQELYDRRTDPYELTSVADDPGYATIKARLASKLVKLADCKGEACNVKP